MDNFVHIHFLYLTTTMDFSGEPAHSSRLQVRDEKPYNAEPDVAQLIEHELTPDELVYCRNHCEIGVQSCPPMLEE